MELGTGVMELHTWLHFTVPKTRQPNETRGGAGEAAGMGLEALTAPAPPCENMARLVEVFERGVGMRAGCPTFSLCGPVSQASPSRSR